MKKAMRFFSLVMAYSMMFCCTTAFATDTVKDLRGKNAPAIAGVTWLAAPTMGGKYETLLYETKNQELKSLPIYRFVGSKQGVVDAKGNVILPAKYGSIDSEQYCLGVSLGTSGIVAEDAVFDFTGKQLTPHIYLNIYGSAIVGDVPIAYANVSSNVQTAINLKNGKEILRAKFVGSFDPMGYASFQDADGKCGYFDITGKKTYAPSNFISCVPINGILECGVGKWPYEDTVFCDLSFHPLLTFTDAQKKNGDVHAYQDEKLIQFTTLSAAGDETVTMYNYEGKVTDAKAPIDQSNYFPEGYQIFGGYQSGDFEPILGLKDPNGKIILQNRYSHIRYLKGRSGPCFMASTFTGSALHATGTKWVLIDAAGKILTSGSNSVLEQASVFRGNMIDEVLPGVFACRKTNNAVDNWNVAFCAYNDKGVQIVKPTAFTYYLPGCIVSSCPVSAEQWYTRKTNAVDADGRTLKSDVDYFVVNSVGSAAENGLTRVCQNSTDSHGKIGFCDENFNLVIPCVFDDAMEFANGQAFVKYNGKWGIIDNPFNSLSEVAWNGNAIK